MDFICGSTVGFQSLEPVGMLECPVRPTVSQSVSRMLAISAVQSEGECGVSELDLEIFFQRQWYIHSTSYT